MPPSLPRRDGESFGGAALTGVGWPVSTRELEVTQREIGHLAPEPWRPQPDRDLIAAGAFVASATGLMGAGSRGDPLWATAVVLRVEPGRPDPVTLDQAVVRGEAGAPYLSGFLALREGPLLERAVRALGPQADVVVVNATGRDHPRRAGLAVHLGVVLERPTMGVTDRALVGSASDPAPERGAWVPLEVEGVIAGAALRTRRGARAVLVHAGWRTEPDVAREVVVRFGGRARTPEPIRLARRLAREVRARDEGRAPTG